MPRADLILKNANVITMNPIQPAARIVAVQGNRIGLVGGDDELDHAQGVHTRVIDCQGKTVVPGFNDAHCHLFSFVRQLLSLDLSPAAVGSIDDIKAALKRQSEITPPGEWITGTDYNDFYLAEKRHPNRGDIDAVTPQHPVLLVHRSLHACVLNGRALELAGITAETPEPPGGLIDREPASGEPNGTLYEMLGYIRERVLPPLSEEEKGRGIALANRYYLSHGITSLQEASVTNSLERWQTLLRWQAENRLHSRVSMMFGLDALEQIQETSLTPHSGDDRLRLGGVKIMLSETTGSLQPPSPELNRQALAAHQAGFQVAFHAVEPGTVAAAITALEHVNRNNPVRERRHRIEHCSECPPELLKRLARLPVVVVSQPPFLYYSGERYINTIPPERFQWLYRFRSFMDSGLVVAAGSDSPVVPADPMVGVYAAVTRRTETGQEILPEERVSIEQALAMYTANAAYASFEEAEKGTISPGKLADMVVLSSDPTSLPAEAIKDIKVEMTIIDGEVVWEG